MPTTNLDVISVTGRSSDKASANLAGMARTALLHDVARSNERSDRGSPPFLAERAVRQETADESVTVQV